MTTEIEERIRGEMEKLISEMGSHGEKLEEGVVQRIGLSKKNTSNSEYNNRLEESFKISEIIRVEFIQIKKKMDDYHVLKEIAGDDIDTSEYDDQVEQVYKTLIEVLK